MSIEVQPLLMDVHKAFAETDLGHVLAAQVRYERYKPADVSNERWVGLLGADVNNLTHLPLTLGLASVMVGRLRQDQPGLLDTREENLLGAAAIIHDWAEAIVGDVNYNDKTAALEAEEARQLAVILAGFQGVETSTAQTLINQAAQEIVFNPTTKLGHIFNTVERVGYMRTALRAVEHVLSGEAPDCEAGLQWLAFDVLGNQTLILIDRAETYPPVDTYLINRRPVIETAFTAIQPEVLKNYELGERRAKAESFYQSAEGFWTYLVTIEWR